MKHDVENCAADSDIETPVLSRDGRSLLLLGCWNPDTVDGGGYAVRAYVGGVMVAVNMPATAGAWVDHERAVLGDSTGVVNLVDFSKSPPAVTEVVRTERSVVSLSASSSGSKIAIILNEVVPTSPSGATAIITSLKSDQRKEVTFPKDASAFFWMGDDNLIVEVNDHRLIIDSNSAEVIERAEGPIGCRLVGATETNSVNYCPKTGEVSRTGDGEVSTIAKITGQDLQNATVSIASGLL